MQFRQMMANFFCLDADGNRTDWWLMYRIPNGLEYYYCSPTQVVTGGVLCQRFGSSGDVRDPLADDETPLYRTVIPLNKHAGSSDEVTWFAYNDQWGGTTHSGGHNKGLVAFDQEEDGTGFWINHSMPQFPVECSGNKMCSVPADTTNPESFIPSNIPNGGNGQHIFCRTLDNDLATQDAVINYLGRTAAAIYLGNNLPNVLEQQSNWIGTNIGWDWIDEVAEVFSFSKGESPLVMDVWDALAEQILQHNMLVQTMQCTRGGALWIRSSEWVSNIIYLQDVYAHPEGVWKMSGDHSKWAISAEETPLKWVCFGDMNREKSQMNRGGGGLCIKHGGLWEFMNSLVVSWYDSDDNLQGESYAEVSIRQPKIKPKEAPAFTQARQLTDIGYDWPTDTTSLDTLADHPESSMSLSVRTGVRATHSKVKRFGSTYNAKSCRRTRSQNHANRSGNQKRPQNDLRPISTKRPTLVGKRQVDALCPVRSADDGVSNC